MSMQDQVTNEVFYDAVGELGRQLADVEATIRPMASDDRAVYTAAIALLAGDAVGLFDPNLTDAEAMRRINQALAISRWVQTTMADQRAADRRRAREAAKMASNEGPLVGDETVNLDSPVPDGYTEEGQP